MGHPELASDPRYATHHAQGEHQVQLDALIDAWATRVENLGLLEQFAVPGGLISPEMFTDPHCQAREAIVSVPHPDFCELTMQNVAPKLSEAPGGIRSPSPRMGEHNETVHWELLGLSAERLRDLEARRRSSGTLPKRAAVCGECLV